jgi:hypothetical protein
MQLSRWISALPRRFVFLLLGQRIQLGSLDQRPFSFRAPDISMVGNGTSCARLKTVPCLCFGSQTAPRDFAADKLGASRSPINPSSTMRQTALTLEERGSSRD